MVSFEQKLNLLSNLAIQFSETDSDGKLPSRRSRRLGAVEGCCLYGISFGSSTRIEKNPFGLRPNLHPYESSRFFHRFLDGDLAVMTPPTGRIVTDKAGFGKLSVTALRFGCKPL